jgi:uncharacterized protein YjbJ (UPF0337 family)
MNTEQIHGHLRTMKGWALENWGRVTHDPWMRLAGRREQLLGRLEASLAQSRRMAEATFPLPRNPHRAPANERRARR